MKVSELTNAVIAEYIHIDANDTLIAPFLDAAKQYAASYTGRTISELDAYEDITIAVLALMSDMYDQRSMIVDKANINQTAIGILSAHSINLIPRETDPEEEPDEEVEG